MSNLRILGGAYKDKKLFLSVSPLTRPVQAVVRGVLFNWLDNDVTGKHCLDLFAGSGIISWEVLSRGAASSTLIEQNPSCCRQLGMQARELGYGKEQANILKRDVYRWLRRSKQQTQKFDLIFVDPPYTSKYLEICLELIIRQGLLATGGGIFFTTDRKTHKALPWLQGEQAVLPYTTDDEQNREFAVVKQSRRGNTCFALIAAPKD